MLGETLVIFGLFLDLLGVILLGFLVRYKRLPDENLESIKEAIEATGALGVPVSPSLKETEEEKKPKNPSLYYFSWFLIIFGYIFQLVGNIILFYI